MKISNLILLTIVGFACIGMATAAEVVVQGGVKACSNFAAPQGADFGIAGLDASLLQPIMSPVKSYTIEWCGPYDVKCEALAKDIFCLPNGKLTAASLDFTPTTYRSLHETLKVDFQTTGDSINKIFDCGDITMPIESGSGTASTTVESRNS